LTPGVETIAPAASKHELITRMREVVRFALPPNSVAAVASGGDDDLLDLGDTVRPRHFPTNEHGAYAGSEPRTWTRAIFEVESLRLIPVRRYAPVQFLLFPAGEWQNWITRYPQLREYLENECRLVVEEPGVCSIFALETRKVPLYDPPDGLPMPSPELVMLVAGVYAPAVFFESGLRSADRIRAMLDRRGLDIAGFESLLDLGCGCGRVMRHWKWLRGCALHGADYNPYLVDWCSQNLRFARFVTNDGSPPLRYDEDAFDFVYAISVFTHLDASLQLPWMRELRRVLRPDGLLYLTLHGRGRLDELGDAERARFEAGDLVVRGAGDVGTNACSAYHPEPYVRETFAEGWEVLDYVADGADDVQQDALLLRNLRG
jgi:SAM-dependent methyltransferase